jgi:hypothetical protein
VLELSSFSNFYPTFIFLSARFHEHLALFNHCHLATIITFDSIVWECRRVVVLAGMARCAGCGVGRDEGLKLGRMGVNKPDLRKQESWWFGFYVGKSRGWPDEPTFSKISAKSAHDSTYD